MKYKRCTEKPGVMLNLAVCLVMMACFYVPAEAGTLLGYQEPESRTQVAAVLYFRYLDSQWLGQESRIIEVPRTESLEKALVQALLDGPKSGGEAYRALFPRGIKVLNVLEESGRMFVTFSEHLMNPMEGEEALTNAGKSEAILRRRLAMASLVNTLTELGNYHSVQVLVVNNPGLSTSLRLSLRYYLEDNDTLPDPLVRQEETILTPGYAAEYILDLWKKQDWSRFSRLLASRPSDGDSSRLPDDFQTFPVLISSRLTLGSISPDGSYAITLLDAGFRLQDGQEFNLTDFPLKMVRQNQAWLLSQSSLQKLIEAIQ
jgi:hypothetical protein